MKLIKENVAFTQVDVLRSGPLGEGQVLVKGFDDFLLHLADGVRVHHLDGERVHAATLKGHVDVLQRKKQKKPVNCTAPVFGNPPPVKASEEDAPTHLWLGFDILPEQPLLVEGVARFARDGVDGALVDLLLDGAQQEEERLAHRFLKKESNSVSDGAGPSAGKSGPPRSHWTRLRDLFCLSSKRFLQDLLPFAAVVLGC